MAWPAACSRKRSNQRSPLADGLAETSELIGFSFSVIAGLQKGETTLHALRPLKDVIFDKLQKEAQWAVAGYWLSCKWSAAG